jgi:putative FmdB family regulatory protein
MPTYVYSCELHGEFEEFHSIKEKLEECPKCKEEGIDPPKKVKRLISGGTSFILSGTGWAKDSYG